MIDCGIQPVTGSQCQALNQFSEEQGNANGLIYQMPQATKSNNPLLEMGQRWETSLIHRGVNGC